MTTFKTMRRSLAISAQLALVAFLSIGFTTTPHDSVANTLPSVRTRAPVLAPSKKDIAEANKTAQLDGAMGALTEREASLYRLTFAAQARGEWNRAEALARQIKDTRLMGHVQADRLEKQGGAQDLAASEAPEAAWRGGGDRDGAAEFTAELTLKEGEGTPQTLALARALQKSLRKNDPWSARALLIEAQSKQHSLSGTFAAEAQAAIGAAFFRAGERDQAAALSGAAAAANQPLGLWVRGLIAWEKKDAAQAARLFSRLAEHPSLTVSNRAAAHFWAYRALAADGAKSKARGHLEAAAKAPRSFYGLLAGQLLGRSPVAVLGKAENGASTWGAVARDRLIAHEAGWRALALLQVGQTARAEAELRRINPQGDETLQNAMMALATYVPMPALALQLAQRTSVRDFEVSLYPLLPWQPQEGYRVDRALLFALARQESLFNPAAVSHRGAQGLMQIMPATAGKMTGSEEEATALAKDGDKLFDPAFNMALGQRYLQHLSGMSKIGNNLVLLLAAYNAGPAKALSWSEQLSGTDPLLFMESIPWRETRGYVARVLPHYWAYRARLGKANPSLKQMAEGQWPTAPLTEDTAPTLRIAQAQ